MKKIFKNKKILVTGACGTVGRELIKQIIARYTLFTRRSNRY